jgi:hypothetical protein
VFPVSASSTSELRRRASELKQRAAWVTNLGARSVRSGGPAAASQISDALACGSENRIAKCGDERRNPGLAHSSGWRGTLGNVNIRLNRNFVDSCDWIITEIGLLDHPILGSDLAGPYDARSEDGRSFNLGPRRFRINDQPRINRRVTL